MVWCAIWNNQIIGPYFFPAGVSGVSFLEMLQTFLSPYLEDLPLQQLLDMWLQLDGAPAHYSAPVRVWMNNNFPGHWIGRGGPVAWPPRSPNLNPLDYFFWGFVKTSVFRTPPLSLDDLKDRIRRTVRDISPQMLTNVRRAFYDRIEQCMWVNGQHFEHLK